MEYDPGSRMSNRGLATGVFRAWGVMWWIYALLAVPRIVAMLASKPYRWQEPAIERFAFSAELLQFVALVGIAGFLTARADWLARVVFPIEQEMHISIGALDLRTVLFAAIGLYFFLDGLRGLAGNGYHLITKPRGDERNAVAYLWQKSGEGFTRSLVGTVVGALVLFRPRGLSGLYQNVFGLGGTRKEEP